jgi:2,6-dihydroxypseudooxynicotine hydrolase
MSMDNVLRAAALPRYANPGRMVADGISFADLVRVSQRLEQGGEWCAEWLAVADRYQGLGEQAAASGNRHSAGYWLWMASLSAHYGQYMLFEDPDRRTQIQRHKVALYQAAAPFLDPRAVRFDLPVAGFTVPGYVRLPMHVTGPIPWVMLLGGLESTKEESLLFENLCLSRGMATVAFDGPGQGEMLEQTVLRHDFEMFARAVFDFAVDQFELDPQRATVLGRSFGGYLALRAAAGVPEFIGCLCWSGTPDLSEITHMAPNRKEGFLHIAGYDEATDEAITAVQRLVTIDDVADQVRCPVLILHGNYDAVFSAATPRRIKSLLTNAPVEVRIEPDGDHCCHNLAELVRPALADWLAEVLGIINP